MNVIEKRTERLIIKTLDCADTRLKQRIGLLGRFSIPKGYGLYFPGCKVIHTWFMLFSIDLIYIDENWEIVKLVHSMRPWRLSKCEQAIGVIETAPGLSYKMGLNVHMQLQCID